MRGEEKKSSLSFLERSRSLEWVVRTFSRPGELSSSLQNSMVISGLPGSLLGEDSWGLGRLEMSPSSGLSGSFLGEDRGELGGREMSLSAQLTSGWGGSL